MGVEKGERITRQGGDEIGHGKLPLTEKPFCRGEPRPVILQRCSPAGNRPPRAGRVSV